MYAHIKIYTFVNIEMADHLKIISSVKLSGFRSLLEATCVSRHSGEL